MTPATASEARSGEVWAPEVGIHRLPPTTYRAAPGISSSALKDLRISPYAFRFRQRNPRVPTSAMLLGTAIHTAVLEPERFKAEYDVRTRHHSKKVDGKTEAEERPEVTFLSRADWLTIGRILDAIGGEHPTGAEVDALVTAAHEVDGIELSLFASEEGARWKKGRPDICLFDDGAMLDVKSTTDGSPHSFSNAIEYGSLHLQAGWNMMLAEELGKPCDDYLFIVLETEPPYEPRVYQLDPAAVKEGKDEARELYARYLDCVTRDEWAPAQSEPTVIGRPAWAYRD